MNTSSSKVLLILSKSAFRYTYRGKNRSHTVVRVVVKLISPIPNHRSKYQLWVDSTPFPPFSLKALRSLEPSPISPASTATRQQSHSEPFQPPTWMQRLKTRRMLRFCSEWHHCTLDDKSTFSMSKWHTDTWWGAAAIWSLETSSTTILRVLRAI